MATVLAGRKERRQKWWAKKLKAKTKSKDNPKAASGGGKKGRRRCSESVVLEQTQFEEEQVDISSPCANRSGFKSSRALSSLKTRPGKRSRNQPSIGSVHSSSIGHTDTSTRHSKSSDTLSAGKVDTSDHSSSDSGGELETTGGQAIEQSGKRRRYIAFIGNLPFSVTGEEVVEHFAKRGVRIVDVRLLTKRGSGESRGCCFVEFPNTKTLQNGLKFHHGLMEGRRLNIEVTCGGGGRGDSRMKKIKERNERLRKARRKRVKSRKDKEQ